MRPLLTLLVAFIVAVVFIGHAPALPPVAGTLASSGTASAWDTPPLAAPQTIQITDTSRNLKLDQSKDYVLRCDSTGTLTYGLVVWGGHNVTLQDCNYDMGSVGSGAAQFKNQTGTLWLDNVHFAGTALTEGIDLQEPGTTTVVLRDVLVDEVHGTYATNHADCIQAWSGPQRFLIDGFTCTTQYQGLFLLPNQQDATTVETVWDFRHVDLNADVGHGYLLYRGDFHSIADLNLADFYENGVSAPADFPDRTGNCAGPCGLQSPDVQVGLPAVGHWVIPSSKYGAVGPDETSSAAFGAGADPVPLIGET